MLYVVRHGQTDWNGLKKMQGSTDIALNENGIAQAYQTKEQLCPISFDLVFSSPLQRALTTCTIITDGKNKIVLDKRLAERFYGNLEGVYFDIENDFRLPFWQIDRPHPIQHPTVETLAAFTERVYSFLDSIKPHKEKTVLLVCHAGVLRVITQYFKGAPASKNLMDYSPENCEIRMFEF